jgi:DNA polymerase-3 subunit epsilon
MPPVPSLACPPARPHFQPLAFVDLETTGMNASEDRIIEVGVVEVDADGVREWSSLVQPGTRIPPFITALTGIDDAGLAGAPRFAQIAAELHQRLAGRLFIAHNARFDHGFLRNEFRRVGLAFQPVVLCTVRLSRRLFPGWSRHSLDALIERHRLDVSQRHRALGDARLIWQFWQLAQREAGDALLTQTVLQLTARPSLPPHLDGAIVDELPASPGVYLFYGENRLPLYVGKASQLRRRVLSHFSSDHRIASEQELCQQVRRIEWIETAGELGALLEEARLVKRLVPLHNRRLRQSLQLCAWRIVEGPARLRIELAEGDDLFFDQDEALYGLYASAALARSALRRMAEQHQLCLVVLGLERTRAGRSCFGHQIGRCHGACVGSESAAAHTARLYAGLEAVRLQAWPFAHPIGIREGDVVHVLDRWCYLGTARSHEEMHALAQTCHAGFDRDVYRIVQPRLAALAARIVALPQAA